MIKFVVNGDSRTGTHFLQSLLNDHPDITCYWDIFWNQDETPLGYVSYRSKFGTHSRFNPFNRNKVLFTFLDDHYAASEEIGAAGFILKTITVQHHPKILKWMKRNRVKVIHLVRQNHLMREVALELRRTRVMAGHATSPYTYRKVHMNIDGLVQRLAYSEKKIQKHRKRLAGMDVLEVRYESLVNDQVERVSHILQFLQVATVAGLTSEFHKTEQESPRNMIDNYEEVRKALQGTSFERFLDCSASALVGQNGVIE